MSASAMQGSHNKLRSSEYFFHWCQQRHCITTVHTAYLSSVDGGLKARPDCHAICWMFINTTAMMLVGSWHQLTVTVTVNWKEEASSLPSSWMHDANHLHIRPAACCPQENFNCFTWASKCCESWYCAAKSKEQFFAFTSATLIYYSPWWWQ